MKNIFVYFILLFFSALSNANGIGDDVYTLPTVTYTTVPTFPIHYPYGLPGVNSGIVHAQHFKLNTFPLDSNDYLYYQQSTGTLYYDFDANGGIFQGWPIINLPNNTPLTNINIFNGV